MLSAYATVKEGELRANKGKSKHKRIITL